MNPQPEFPVVLEFFKALANESRLRLLGLLAQRELNVHELAAELRLTEPTVSHHLAVLKRLGILRRRVDGTTHWYALEPDALVELSRTVFSREQVPRWAPAQEKAVPDMLRNFVTADGTLTQIPASRKKRRIVLAWLTGQFENARVYSEAEVNRVIKRHHPDCATLRRELVGYRMMSREASRYQRMPEGEWTND